MRVVIIAVCLFIFSSNVFAQNIPPGDQPGADAARYQKEVEQKKKALERKKPEVPEIEIEKESEAPPTEGPSFVLKKVKITGMTIFEPGDFKPIYEPYLGKKITFKDLDAIVEKIKAEYKKKGYLTTTAYIPRQAIVEGEVEIKVVEGKMGSLKVEGNKWFSLELIKRYFHSKKNEILNIIKVQQDILRLNQNPDLEVRTVITAGALPETSDVTLKVEDKFPYHIGASVDNQGTRLVGKYRPAISFRSTNLTGNNDSLFVNTMLSSGAFGESVLYSLPITAYGTKLGFDFTYFFTQLGKEFKTFDIEGETQIYIPHISQELYLSEDFQATGDIGLEIKSIKKFMHDEITANDQLRLPYVGFDLSKLDPFFGGGQTTFGPRFTFGTANFLGASSHGHSSASREGTGGFFFKYEHSLNRIQKMPFESYISVRSQFQAAAETLTSAEQFQLGGANSIRGYPEGDYLCDIGAGLNVDWVFPTYFFPPNWKLPYSKTPLRKDIQPVVFLDLGGGMLEETLPGERKEKFLMGIGGGLRVHLYSTVYARLEWAAPIGAKPTAGTGPAAFHLTIQTEL